MAQASREEVTGLLQAWSDGDQAALDKLMPLVYAELHRLAKRYMGREHEGHSLQTSALVNEAYLRLVDAHGVRWQNRTHFFAVSAQIMRRILVDFARARQNLKRGGGALQVTLEEGLVGNPAQRSISQMRQRSKSAKPTRRRAPNILSPESGSTGLSPSQLCS